MAGSWHITPKGRAYLAAVETGLVENTDEDMMKFEAFWERSKLGEQPTKERAKNRAAECAECIFASLVGGIFGALFLRVFLLPH